MNAEAEVDELLAAWEERLRRIDENLVALESEPTYELLTGVRGHKTALEGITRHRVGPALEALGELFEHRARLTDVVERAKAIRASVSFWDRDQRLAEIKELLDGPSIKMSGSPKPLAQRSLLDPAGNDVAVVPERLLEAMVEVYRAARDAVTAVSRAWARLEPVLEGAEGELTSLKLAAREIGIAAEVAPELAWLDRELAGVRAQVSRDPLGVSSGVDAGLAPRLAELRRRLRDLKAQKSRVALGLRGAPLAEREVKEAHQVALDAIARAESEVTGVVFSPVTHDAQVAGLVPWREKIEEAARAGRFGPADVGLSRWNETVRAYLAQDRAVVAKVEAVLQERVELTGRLSARRAQLEALVARGVVAPAGLVGRGLRAEALLRARPTPLAEAASELERYEAEIVALAARARRG